MAERRIHPIERPRYNPNKGTLTLSGGFIEEDGKDNPVDSRTHVYYGVEREKDGSFNLDNTLCGVERTEKDRKALDRQIHQMLKPHPIRDFISEYWLEAIGSAALLLGAAYYLYNKL